MSEMDLYQIASALFPSAPKNDPRLAAFVREIPELAGLSGYFNANGDVEYEFPEPDRYAQHQLEAVRHYLSGATAQVFGNLLVVGVYNADMRLVALAVENLNQAELDGDMHYAEADLDGVAVVYVAQAID